MRYFPAVFIVLISFSAQCQPQFDLQLNESQTNPNGECIIEIRAIHSDGKPVQGLKTILKNSSIIRETDAQGITRIEMHDPLTEDQIHVELNGYSTPGQSIKLKGFNHFFGIVVEEPPTNHRKIKVRKKHRRDPGLKACLSALLREGEADKARL